MRSAIDGTPLSYRDRDGISNTETRWVGRRRLTGGRGGNLLAETVVVRVREEDEDGFSENGPTRDSRTGTPGPGVQKLIQLQPILLLVSKE